MKIDYFQNTFVLAVSIWFALAASALKAKPTEEYANLVSIKPPIALLEIDHLEFPDGNEFSFGPNGKQSFRVRMHVRNGSKGGVKIWNPDCSECSFCPSLELIDGQGRRRKITLKLVSRITGTPGVLMLTQDFPAFPTEFDIPALLEGQTLPVGTYRIRGIYYNRIPGDNMLPYYAGVWTGKIASPFHSITVAEGKPKD